MSRSFFLLIVFFILFTTYKPKFNLVSNLNLNIQEIIIENTAVLDSDKIVKKINFLYNKNLFFLDTHRIEKNLKNISFIDSFSVKKVYPNKLKLIITEKKPIAILQNKKEKTYISDKGDLIEFNNLKIYKDLPTVFGNRGAFYSLYKNLENIKFPFEKVKSFYFFESGRWDLIMNDNKVIKLPIEKYLYSLENFMKSTNDKNFDNYKTFDYRIKDQLILN
ncbi:FtsQ-type POTRA domain-containing protein [Pelagibacteraceae bacterium]|nr:FtsQ-type POTRA domain-containing protein [Pelagibacteraceae bacterium]